MSASRPLTPGAERLLAAASALFYEHGIHAVGVDTIASEAGVTKKTLYDRFGSKEALAVAYLRRRDDRWREQLEAALADTDPGVPSVVAFFEEAEHWAEGYGPRGCASINARAETPDPDHPVAREVTRQKEWVRDLLLEHCRAAGVDDPTTAADVLMVLYDGALVETGLGVVNRPFATALGAAKGLLVQG